MAELPVSVILLAILCTMGVFLFPFIMPGWLGALIVVLLGVPLLWVLWGELS